MPEATFNGSLEKSACPGQSKVLAKETQTTLAAIDICTVNALPSRQRRVRHQFSNSFGIASLVALGEGVRPLAHRQQQLAESSFGP